MHTRHTIVQDGLIDSAQQALDYLKWMPS